MKFTILIKKEQAVSTMSYAKKGNFEGEQPSW